jgi:MFS family permease
MSSRGLASLGKRTFISFKNPIYRTYFGGIMGQIAAMNMQQVVGSLLIYRVTNSAAILGAMGFAGAIPMLICSFFGGIIADRFNKKKVLIIGQSVFALTALMVAITLSTGYLSSAHAGSWWILVVSSALQGGTMGMTMPSRQALIPQIVSSEQLMNAISLNTMGMNLLQIIAPAAAGFLVEAFNFEAVYYVMTVMYLAAVFFFFILPKNQKTARATESALKGILQGMKYVVHNANMLLILVLSTVIVFLAMPYNNMMAIFVDDVLHVGAGGMGVLMSVSGVGALVGSVIMATLPNRRRGILFIFSGLLLGLSLTGFAFSSSWPLSIALMAVIGLAQTGRMTLSSTLIQSYVDNEFMGRVMALYMMQFGFSSLSTFLAGILAEGVGVQWAVGSLAILLSGLTLVAIAFVPRIRKLD